MTVKKNKKNYIASCLVGTLVSSALYAGDIGTVVMSHDSRIRVSGILFDANQITMTSNFDLSYTNNNGSGSLSQSVGMVAGNKTTASGYPFVIDGLTLDYEKDMNKFNFLIHKYVFRPMLGVRLLGKWTNTTEFTSTFPNEGLNIPGVIVGVDPTQSITIQPWGLMGAIYLGANTDITEKLNFSARVGPLLSAYDLQYLRSVTLEGNTTLSTYQHRTSRLGYGAFGSLAVGYQLTHSFDINAELMYSGFTGNTIKTPFSYTRPSLDPNISASQTGSIAGPYISDVLGMVGVSFKF